MSQDKELEIQRQFLDEAQVYLDTLESALLGASNRIDIQKINAALRAAHSIKGGAGMMGFHTLSEMAHRLEDAFKVLKLQKQTIVVDAELENLLLSGVDCLRSLTTVARETMLHSDRAQPITEPWPDQARAVFADLHARLGDPQAEDAVSVLASEDSQDILPVLFETDVEQSLQHLETVLLAVDPVSLHAELTQMAQELSGLGAMLQLTAFSQLSESVLHALTVQPDAVTAIAQAALQAWRRSQALILTGQLGLLPSAIAIEMATTTPHDRRADAIDDPVISPDAFSRAAVNQAVEQPSLVVPSDSTWQESPAATRSQSVRASQISDFKVLDTESAGATPALEENPDATVRVPLKQLNRLNDALGELTIERNALDLYLKRLRGLTQTLKRRLRVLDVSNADVRTAYDRTRTTIPVWNTGLAGGWRSPKLLKPNGLALDATAHYQPPTVNAGLAGTAGEFDALELDRYDDLHLLSQQVIETIVQLQEVTSDIELSLDDTEQTARNLHKTARQMQTDLTQVRMRPLSDIVDRFPRALRDLCLQYGKQAKLVLLGSGTLIDRSILEALNDPLMHLLRNAFDHGIEDPETRQQQGKPPEGTIEIQAFHQGNRTVITVRDDGGGIPIAKIRARATEMGLDAALLAAASDDDLLPLIFEPGFSTADQVTTLSGRGVGMDVVRSCLQSVRGDITVATTAGGGTTFTLSVPFTLSVVRVLLVESNGMLLAFPIDTISEMVVLQPEDVLKTAGNEVFAWGETIVPLLLLSHWLEFRCYRQPITSEATPNINTPAVLMVRQGMEVVGIQVDRGWGEQEVAVRRVEGTLPMPAGFTNCTIMGDGRVVPLVNVPELLHWIASHSWTPTAPTAPSPPVHRLPEAPVPRALPPSTTTILVVDDSINVRRFLALTLERAGYRVEQAKDGQDALEKLQRGLTVQAVICDIEMPRLDGFGFLAKVKANPTLDHLPVVMLTSRSGDKHRQLAMNLGATAYFSKPYNEQALLRGLEHIMGMALV